MWASKSCQHDDLCQKLTPCENDGICIPSLGGYTCECPRGWTGKNCTTKLSPCDGTLSNWLIYFLNLGFWIKKSSFFYSFWLENPWTCDIKKILQFSDHKWNTFILHSWFSDHRLSNHRWFPDHRWNILLLHNRFSNKTILSLIHFQPIADL